MGKVRCPPFPKYCQNEFRTFSFSIAPATLRTLHWIVLPALAGRRVVALSFALRAIVVAFAFALRAGAVVSLAFALPRTGI